MDTEQLLLEFLSMPLDSGTPVLDRFATLPNALRGRGASVLEDYVYVPGSRKNRVLLVAHADTVWDSQYNTPHIGSPGLKTENGCIRGTLPDCGIGADDRSGCAMLWALKDSGHSLLVVNGEEHGKIGAGYLKKSAPGLFRELNRHCFMLELDWRGTGGCLFNQVKNTRRFRRYITTKLGFQVEDKKGGCDLQILCKRVCGANVGVGYHCYHKNNEYLSIKQWEHTYFALREFLRPEHPRFRADFIKVICGYGAAALRRIRDVLKRWLGMARCQT